MKLNIKYFNLNFRFAGDNLLISPFHENISFDENIVYENNFHSTKVSKETFLEYANENLLSVQIASK